MWYVPWRTRLINTVFFRIEEGTLFEAIKIFNHVVASQDMAKAEDTPFSTKKQFSLHLKKVAVILQAMGAKRKLDDTTIVNLFFSDKSTTALIEEWVIGTVNKSAIYIINGMKWFSVLANYT